MKTQFFLNPTPSGRIQITGMGEYSAGGGVCRTYNAPKEARTVLCNLGYGLEFIDKQLRALPNFNPEALLRLPEIEVEQRLLNENGFAAIY